MKKLLLMALLLLPLAYASQSPLEKFLGASFEPDQAVSTQPVQSEGGYIVISADGKETYVFDLQAGQPLSGSAEMEALLSADAKNRTGFGAKLSSALSFAANASSAKDHDEKKCMQYTGTDMHPCFGKDSCVLACMAVPLCSTPLYSDGFWEAILDWTNRRIEFGSALSAYNQGLDAELPPPETIDSKLAALDSLSALSSNMSKNPLFLNRTDEGCFGSNITARCFEFCPKIDYSAAGIAAQKQNLQSLKSSVLTLQQQPARALAIYGNGKTNGDYLAARGKNYEEFRIGMQNSLRRLGARAASLAENVTDPQIAPLLESLSNLSSSIVAQADSGYYRAALAQKPQFDRQEAELSGRMDSDAKAFSGVLSDAAAAMAKVDKAESVIGAESAGYYREDLGAISKTLHSSPTSGDMVSAKEKLRSLNEVLTAEIAAKAVGEEPKPHEGPAQNATQQNQTSANLSQKPPKYPQPMKLPSLPCAPALILLSVVALASARRSV